MSLLVYPLSEILPHHFKSVMHIEHLSQAYSVSVFIISTYEQTYYLLTKPLKPTALVAAIKG